MAEIDPIILQIKADVRQMRAELLSTTSLVEATTGRQERAIIDLERQFKRSSANISGSLRSLAGGLAGYFSVQQITSAIDAYTRFQNQLRIAGLEGQALADTQERLLRIANLYGVELEAVGTLYGRASASASDLGFSQSQLFKLTELTAASLKITGTSATAASGALLQLGQVLGGSKVQAEEYNSLIDTLRPLLQAVASGSDRWGGSVNKLTRDIKDSKVAVSEFADAALKGADGTILKSEKSVLTLAGAFTKLSNQLTVYIGQSAEANGATSALTGGIELLANNLDTVADAFAVIAAVMLGRYVRALTVSTAATVRLALASAGTTTALGAMAIGARAAGGALLTAFGGPVGAAVFALTLGIGYLATRTEETIVIAKQYQQAQGQSEDATNKLRDAVDKLATAHGKARVEALKEADAQRQNTIQKRNAAKASLDLARAELARLKTFEASVIQDPGLFDPGAVITGSQAEQAKSNAAIDRLTNAIAKADSAIAGADAALNAPPPGAPRGVVDDEKTKKRTKAGPSAADIEQRFLDEMTRLRAEQIQDEISITNDAETRAELQGDLIRAEYKERLRAIQNDKDFNDAQKKLLKAELDRTFGVDPTDPSGDTFLANNAKGIAQNRQTDAELARNRAQIARDEGAALQAEAELADTRLARLAIERAILEQREIEERASLDAAIAAGQVADAVKARAALEREQAARRTKLNRDFESPFQSYARRLGNQGANIDDEVEALVVQRLDEVDDAITDAISSKLGVKDPLLKSLLNLFIQQTLIRPIADALAGVSGGGGGIGGFFGAVLGGVTRFFGGGGPANFDFSSSLPPNVGWNGKTLPAGQMSIFGRASGGYVGPGQTVRVNEHKGGVELLRMGSQGGHVVPLGQANARAARPASQTIVKQTFVLDNRYGITTPQLLEQVNDIARREAAAAGSASYEQAMKDAPNAVTQARRFGSRAY